VGRSETPTPAGPKGGLEDTRRLGQARPACVRRGVPSSLGSVTVDPPEGHGFVYRLVEELDGLPPVTYSMTLPSAVEKVHAASLRLSREGGPDAIDRKFQADLFVRVGAIVVAAGHAEAAMKRLLILLTQGSGRFSEVDARWSDLERDLRAEAQADPNETRRKRLLRVLDWARDNRIGNRRNDVVHSAWALYDPPGVRGARFRKKSDGETLIWSLADLDRLAELLFQLVSRLDDLAGEDWGRLILPSRSSNGAAPAHGPTVP
jgi:hypothetical protein